MPVLNLGNSPAADGRAAADSGALQEVSALPKSPEPGALFRIKSSSGHPSHTHYLFRFPAKFHPPVVSWALEAYGDTGACVLDPFTGSGTVQVEALVRRMSSVGIDIDPLACLIARAKVTPIHPATLQADLARIESNLAPFTRTQQELVELKDTDLSDSSFSQQSQDLRIPEIPNSEHWFRRHVLVDLARLFWAINEADLDRQRMAFFKACAASIIRKVSNADPAPVSGLEVTRVQAERNAQRVIAVFEQFVASAQKAIDGMNSVWNACAGGDSAPTAHVLLGDASRAVSLLDTHGISYRFPLVITSPPYCTAVNYSRRHKLEMYWLGLVQSPDEHLALSHTYVGRRRVRLVDWDECGEFGIQRLDRTLLDVSERSRTRARALRHYFWSMSNVLGEIHGLVESQGKLVCAIGDSVCCQTHIATTEFVAELAAPYFSLDKQFAYVVRNHYMQYPLRNGAGIRRENILVFTPR
jgi:hypothetical protein